MIYFARVTYCIDAAGEHFTTLLHSGRPVGCSDTQFFVSSIPLLIIVIIIIIIIIHQHDLVNISSQPIVEMLKTLFLLRPRKLGVPLPLRHHRVRVVLQPCCMEVFTLFLPVID